MVLYHDPIAHLSSPPRTGWISLCWPLTQHPLGLLLASWISISGSWYLCPSKDQYSDVDRSCRLFHATSLHWPSPTPLFIFNDTQSHFGLSSFLWLLHSVVSLKNFTFFGCTYVPLIQPFFLPHFERNTLLAYQHCDIPDTTMKVYKNLTHDSRSFERRSLTPWNNTMPRACVSCGFVSSFYWCTLSFILVFMVA